MPDQNVNEKIILGIDPGTTIMGYGILKVTQRKAEMITMGVIDLRKYTDHYLKLGRIYERVSGIINAYLPDEMAIEAPFYGKNVQSMLKLGRLKIKMAITGNGQASKEQVANMLIRMLHIPHESILPFLDATDGLAAAYCHFLQMGRPETNVRYHGWNDFIRKNPDKIKGLK